MIRRLIDQHGAVAPLRHGVVGEHDVQVMRHNLHDQYSSPTPHTPLSHLTSLPSIRVAAHRARCRFRQCQCDRGAAVTLTNSNQGKFTHRRKRAAVRLGLTTTTHSLHWQN